MIVRCALPFAILLAVSPTWAQSGAVIGGGCDAILQGLYNFDEQVNTTQIENTLRFILQENIEDGTTLRERASSAGNISVPLGEAIIGLSGSDTEASDFHKRLKREYLSDQTIVEKSYVHEYYKRKTVSVEVVDAWSACMNSGDRPWRVDIPGGGEDEEGLFTLNLTWLPSTADLSQKSPTIASIFTSPGIRMEGARWEEGKAFRFGTDQAQSQVFRRQSRTREQINIQFIDAPPVVLNLPADPTAPQIQCTGSRATFYTGNVNTSGSVYVQVPLDRVGDEPAILRPCETMGTFRQTGEFTAQRAGLYSIQADGRFGTQYQVNRNSPEYNLAIVHRSTSGARAVVGQGSDRCATEDGRSDPVCNVSASGQVSLAAGDVVFLEARTDLATENKNLRGEVRIELLRGEPEPVWPLSDVRFLPGDGEMAIDLLLLYGEGVSYADLTVSGESGVVQAAFDGDLLRLRPLQPGRATVRFSASNDPSVRKTTSFEVEVVEGAGGPTGDPPEDDPPEDDAPGEPPRTGLPPETADVYLRLTSATAAPGDEFTLRLNIDDASDVLSGGADITYDSTRLRYVSGAATQLATSLWTTVFLNEVEPGSLRLGFFSSTAAGAASGSIAEIRLAVADGAQIGTVIPITVEGEGFSDDGNQVLTVGAEGALVEVGITRLPGDVSGDGKIQPNDAALALAHYLGRVTLSGADSSSADVTGDGRILPNDAAIIFQAYFGTGPLAGSAKVARAEIGSWILRPIRVTETSDGFLGHLPPLSGAYGYALELRYDPAAARWAGARPTVTGHGMFDAEEVQPGRVRLVRFGGADVPQAVRFESPSHGLDVPEIEVASVSAFDAHGRWLRVTRESVNRADVRSAVELEPSQPNPFNPTTALRYRISPASGVSEARVLLEVYGITGQRVRTLVDAVQASGSYAVTWDGRDDSGRPSASGIYIARLTVGDQTRSQRMLLLR